MARDAPPSPPTSTLEQVRRSVPAGSTVDTASIKLPGVELFSIDDHRPAPHDATNLPEIVAIVGGVGKPILHGDDVMRAAIKATNDARVLVDLALAVARKSAAVLDGPRDDVQRKRGVAAPAIANGAVEFWILAGAPSLELLHGRIDLSTGKLELAPPPLGEDEQIDNAIAGLRSSATYGALETLKTRCANPKVRAALFDALANDRRDDVRESVAQALEKCGAAAVDPLSRALADDRALGVKVTAAHVLGNLKDKRAKPALEKAAKSSDSYLADAAKEALNKLQ